MRVLITGASGFAGRYLARECTAAGDEVVGLSRTGAVPDGCGEGRGVDLLDAQEVHRTVRDVRPEAVYHLAALSSVGHSWEDPVGTVQDNVATAINMLEALRLEAPRARVVWISSCQVYGTPEVLPVDETAPLRPDNPYAVSKAAGEMLASVYADAHGLDAVLVRPFNHAGPGQLPSFILSSLARQAAEARASGVQKAVIVTGNPETRRDFTDVRDVARAYRLLVERAERGIYNVSSGHSVSPAEQVQMLRGLLAPIEVEHRVDPDRLRAHEVMDLRGGHDRVSEVTGWEPEIPLRQTMLDTIAWWEEELRATLNPAPPA